MVDDRHEVAVDVVARRMLTGVARTIVLDNRDELAKAFRLDDPTMDEVEARIGQILGSLDPDSDTFVAAYHFLETQQEGTPR